MNIVSSKTFARFCLSNVYNILIDNTIIKNRKLRLGVSIIKNFSDFNNKYLKYVASTTPLQKYTNNCIAQTLIKILSTKEELKLVGLDFYGYPCYKYKNVYIKPSDSYSPVNFNSAETTLEQVNETIASLIMEYYGNNLATAKDANNVDVYIKDVELTDIFKGKHYFEIYDYLNKFKNKNINRAILLYGKPGTGKSIYARAFCNDFGYSTLRIEAGSVNYNVMEVVELLKVQAVIVDEIDKLEKFSPQFIDIIQLLKNKVKLVIFTANKKSILEQYNYIIRPGRIDELFEINNLDKAVAIKIIGKENEDVYEKIKEFPIAFIIEAKNIIDVFGKKHFLDNFESLKFRFDVNNA